jgi:uncharacterized protein YfaS (alpha-2-macroglobulin family)
MVRFVWSGFTAILTALAAGFAAIVPLPAGAAETWTITAIAPEVATGSVRLLFSHPVTMDILQENLKFVPPVQVEWYRSTLDPRRNEVHLHGPFVFGRRHLVIVPEGLPAGGRTYAATLREFTMPPKPPAVFFEGSGSAVERDGRQLVHFTVTGSATLRVETLSVPPILLPLALATIAREQKAPPPADPEQPLSHRAPALTLESLSSSIIAQAGPPNLKGEYPKAYQPLVGALSPQRQLVPIQAGRDEMTRLSVPLTFRDGRATGAAVLVQAFDQESGPASGTPVRAFRVSDLAMTVKRSPRSLLVWVTSLRDGLPRKGVIVYGFSAGAFFRLGETNGDGVVEYQERAIEGISISRGASTPVRRSPPADDIPLLIAVGEKDVTWLEHRAEGVVVSDAMAVKPSAPGALIRKGHLFSERGIYRPGDTVHLKGTVRRYDGGMVNSPAGGACSLLVTDPKGQKVAEIKGALSEFGTLAADVDIAAYRPLGTYTATLIFGDASTDRASSTFMVQEYTPPRHFAEVKVTRSSRSGSPMVNGPAETPVAVIDIGGTYHAGGPVKGGRVRWKVSHAPAERTVEGFDGYHFSYPTGKEPELLESGETVLDEKGTARVQFPLDREVLSGKYALAVSAAVIDFDGKAASASRVFAVEPEFLVGVAPHPASIVQGERLELAAVVLDADRDPVGDGTLAVEVMSRQYVSVRKRNNRGDLVWQGRMVWKRLYTGTTAIERGQGRYTFDFAWGGDYLVGFTYTDKQGRRWTSGTMIDVAWSGWDGSDGDESRGKFETARLVPDRESYRPGDTARVTVLSSRQPARMLVTVEREGIFEWRVVEPGDARSIPVELEKKHAPNVYVSVCGAVPRGEFPLHEGRFDEEAPAFVHGVVNLSISSNVGGLEVSVAGERQSIAAEPGSEVTLDLAVTADGRGAEAELAVGVVDESVLALSGWATPTLSGLARFALPLNVFTADLRLLLLRQSPFSRVSVEPLTGGDGLEGAVDIDSPKVRKDFRPVAFFAPALVTARDGRATVTFRLPDTMTTYRVYVVACDRGGKFGSAQKPLRATRDFYLEPGLPRFFTRGDRFSFEVAAFNRTGTPGRGSFGLKVDGPLALSAPAPLEVFGFGTARVPVQGSATGVGSARITFSGTLEQRQDATEHVVSVRNPYPRGSAVGFTPVTGTVRLPLPFPEAVRKISSADVSPGEVTARVTVSGSPFLRLAPGLRYLLDYPYGCIEQTSSRVLALAGLRQAAAAGLLPGIQATEADVFIRSGIDRILAMQRADGGFGYWPGQGYPSWWGSVYAMAALTQARGGGIEVPAEPFERGLEFLKRGPDEGSRETPDLRAFSFYILARNGRLDAGLLATLDPRSPGLGQEGGILLLLARSQARLAPAEELRQVTSLLLESGPMPKAEARFGAIHRVRALALLLGTAILPGDRLTDAAADRLISAMGEQGRWSSTSDTGWALLALAEYFRGISFPDAAVTVTLRHGDAPPKSAPLQAGGSVTFELDFPASLRDPWVEVSAGGTRTLLARAEVRFPRVEIGREGLDRGFTVTRRIENTDGTGVIRVGDMVKVTVGLESKRHPLEYVVLDDPLPAGLVAVNSALATEERPPDEPGADEDDYWGYRMEDGTMRFVPNYFEIRDDRVLAFRDYLWSGAFAYSYYARAVCAGEFVVPPARVQLMYDPAVEGFSPVGTLRVEPRK